MALKFMFITNRPDIALIAEKNGVDRIWIDLEERGKEARQKHINSVKLHHSINDITALRKVLTKSELMVRINSWDSDSVQEVEDVIAAGAQRIMLPMWKTAAEVDAFLKTVNRRVATTLLLETKEAVECLDEVLKNPLVEEIHIGLNDLHLSLGLDFMFETLANGLVEEICQKIAAHGIPYGFGGIAKIGHGDVPAEYILEEHIRLNSSMVILSRSFYDANKNVDLQYIEKEFFENVKQVRDYESYASAKAPQELEENKKRIQAAVCEVVQSIKNKKNHTRLQ